MEEIGFVTPAPMNSTLWLHSFILTDITHIELISSTDSHAPVQEV